MTSESLSLCFFVSLSLSLSLTRLLCRSYPGLYPTTHKDYSPDLPPIKPVFLSNHIIDELTLANMLPVTDTIEPVVSELENLQSHLCNTGRREFDPERAIGAIKHYQRARTDEESYARLINSHEAPPEQFRLFGHLFGLTTHPGSLFAGEDGDEFYGPHLVKRYQWDFIFKALGEVDRGMRFRRHLLFYITFSYWCHVRARFLVPAPGTDKSQFQRAHELIAIYNSEWKVKEGKKADALMITDQVRAYKQFYEDEKKVDQWVAARPYNQGPIHDACRKLNVISFYFFILRLLDGKESINSDARKKLGISMGGLWAPFRLLACPYPREEEILQYLTNKVLSAAHLCGSKSLTEQKKKAAEIQRKKDAGEAEPAGEGQEKHEVQHKVLTKMEPGYGFSRIKLATISRKYGISLASYFACPLSHLTQPSIVFDKGSFICNFFSIINLFLPLMPKNGVGTKLATALNCTSSNLSKDTKKSEAFRYILAQETDTYAGDLPMDNVLAEIQHLLKEDASKMGYLFAADYMQRQAFKNHPYWQSHARNCYLLVKDFKETISKLSRSVAKESKETNTGPNQIVAFFPPRGAVGPTCEEEWRYHPYSLNCCIYYYDWTAWVEGVEQGRSLSSVESFQLKGAALEAYQYAIDALEQGPAHHDAHTSIGWFALLQRRFEESPWRCVTTFGSENYNSAWLAYAFYRLLYTRMFPESVIWLAVYCLTQDTLHSTEAGKHLSTFRVLEAQRPYSKENEFHTEFATKIEHGFRRLKIIFREHLQSMTNALYTGMWNDEAQPIGEGEDEEERTRGRKRKPKPRVVIVEPEHSLAELLHWNNKPRERVFQSQDNTMLCITPSDWKRNMRELSDRLTHDLASRDRALTETFFPREVQGFLLYQNHSVAPDLCRARALSGVVKVVQLTVQAQSHRTFLQNLDPDFLKFFNHRDMLKRGQLELCVPVDRADKLPIVVPSGRRVWTFGEGGDEYKPCDMTGGRPVRVGQDGKKRSKRSDDDEVSASLPRKQGELKQPNAWPTGGSVYRTYTGAHCYQFVHAVLVNALVAPAAFFLQQFVYRPVYSCIASNKPDHSSYQWAAALPFADDQPKKQTHGRKPKRVIAEEAAEEEKRRLAVPIIDQPGLFVDRYKEKLKDALAPFLDRQPVERLFLESAKGLAADLQAADASTFYLQVSATFALAHLCHQRATKELTAEDAAKISVPGENTQFINTCDLAIAKALAAVKKVVPSDTANFASSRLTINSEHPQGLMRVDLHSLAALEMMRLQTRQRNPFEIGVYSACAEFRTNLKNSFNPLTEKFISSEAFHGLYLRLGQIYSNIYEQLVCFYSPSGAQWFPTISHSTRDKYELEHFRLLGMPFSLEERSGMALVHTLFDCNEYKQNGYYVQWDQGVPEWSAFVIKLLQEEPYNTATRKLPEAPDSVYAGKESGVIDASVVEPDKRWFLYIASAWYSVCVPDSHFRSTVKNDDAARFLTLEAAPTPAPPPLPSPPPPPPSIAAPAPAEPPRDKAKSKRERPPSKMLRITANTKGFVLRRKEEAISDEYVKDLEDRLDSSGPSQVDMSGLDSAIGLLRAGE